MNDFSFLKDLKIDRQFILKTENNRIYNDVIIDYYNRYQKESRVDLSIKIKKIEECNKFWQVDRYDYHLIKDFVRTNLCRDKFCNNCKKVKQASRMNKYIPELKKYNDRLYHVVLTLPNIDSDNLKDTIIKMKTSFRQLIRYINSKDKLVWLDFSKYHYKGAIRSLEITFKDNNYHPHYHCAFVFDNLDLNKIYKNNYSIDYYNNREDILFSDFEISIQKIWFMLLNNIRVTKDNYDSIDLGYSCKCDKFLDDDYLELFKYMTKETNEANDILTYDNFKTLYRSTFNIKQIQGYGCLYMVTDNNIEDEVNKIIEEFRGSMILEDSPIKSYESLLDLLNDNHYTLVTRKQVYQYLQENK